MSDTMEKYREYVITSFTKGVQPIVIERAQGAVVVDMYAAFMAVPDFHKLFFDHVHPNEDGYQIMADEWFKELQSRPVAL